MIYQLRLMLSLMLMALAIELGFCRGMATPSPPGKHTLKDLKLQIAFIQDDFVFCTNRKTGSWYESKKWPYAAASLLPHFYKITLSNRNQSSKEPVTLEFDDEAVIVNDQCFTRWRLTPQMIWGTERSFDDQRPGVFHIPLKAINELKKGQKKNNNSSFGPRTSQGQQIS